MSVVVTSRFVGDERKAELDRMHEALEKTGKYERKVGGCKVTMRSIDSEKHSANVPSTPSAPNLPPDDPSETPKPKHRTR